MDTVAKFISLPFGCVVRSHVEKVCTFSSSWTSEFSNSIMNGPEYNAKRLALYSGPFILKGHIKKNKAFQMFE